MGTAQFVARATDLKQQVSRLLHIHGHALTHIGHLPERTDQQRRGNRDGVFLTLLVPVTELVVQAVLAADERCAQRHGHVVAGQRGAHQRPQRLGTIGVSPAEVVENGDALRDPHRRPRSCGRLRRSHWPPCGTDRDRRSTDSSRTRAPGRGTNPAPGATPRHRSGRHSSTPTSGFTTLPPCTS